MADDHHGPTVRIYLAVFASLMFFDRANGLGGLSRIGHVQ